MRMKFLTLAAALFAAVLSFGPVQAAAVPNAGSLLAAAKVDTSQVEKTAYVRRCWWSGGYRYCRNVWVRPYYRRHYYYRPRYYHRRHYYRRW